MFILCIIILYIVFCAVIAVGFIMHLDRGYDNKTYLPVTVIIPARNEEEYIDACLRSIIEQDYPKELIELILINDASTDQTNKIAEETLVKAVFKYKIINNETRIGKKKSIIKGIESSSSEFIITRDADTFTVSDQWLKSIVSYYKVSQKEFIICPVAFMHTRHSVLQYLQVIESAVVNVFTFASLNFGKPFLCSGANLAFTKDLFIKTGKYSNHIEHPSGDDIFFLEDVKKYNNTLIGGLKNEESIVYTYPEKDFISVIRQKSRWASKVFFNTSVFNLISALIILVVNITWVQQLILIAVQPENAYFSLIFVLIKLLIDILLLFLASRFLKSAGVLAFVLPVGLLYPFYAILIAISTLFVRQKWKE